MSVLRGTRTPKGCDDDSLDHGNTEDQQIYFGKRVVRWDGGVEKPLDVLVNKQG